MLENIVVETEFLLFEDRLLGLEVVNLATSHLLSILIIDQLDLVLNPSLLNLSDLILQVLGLLLNVA